MNIDGRRRMRDRSGGNKIRTRFRIGADIFQRDAAGNLGFNPAADEGDFDRRLIRSHVVQQHALRAAIDRVL